MEDADIFKFSSLTRTLLVLAYCHRFTNNANPNATSIEGALRTSELSMAVIYCIRIVQSQYYNKEISSLTADESLPAKSSLHPLHPFLHEDGTLRVGGRLENSQLPFNAKHQFIIPVSHHFAMLITNDAHLKTLHVGVQLTMVKVRENFWIPALKRKV